MYNWLNWWVPNERISNYIFFLFIGLVLLPQFMGVQFTVLGYLVNLIWLDVFYYWGYKRFKDINDE